jgi:hypothetical protein
MSFIETLPSAGPASDGAEKMGLYGWLIGDWTMDATIYTDDGSRHEQGRNDAGEPTRWRFSDITRDSFCWLGERSTDNGATWQLQSRFLARRAIVPAARPMLDHLSIGVRDFAAAKLFYDATLQPLGYRCLYEDAATLGYGATAPSLWLNAVERPVPPDQKSGLHVCFAAPTQDSVDAFHAHEGGRAGQWPPGPPVPTTVLDITRRSSSIPMAIVSRPIMTARSLMNDS